MKIIRRYGNNQIEMKTAVAGDIVSIAGFQNSTVSNILNDVNQKRVIPSIPIEPPII